MPEPLTQPAAQDAPPVETPVPSPPAADPAPPAPPVDPVPEQDDDPEEEPELTATEWQGEAGKARKQAARYRTERNTARTDLARAQARIAELETVGQQPAPPASGHPDPTAAAEARAQAAELRASRLEAAAEAGVPLPLLKALDTLRDAADAATLRSALDAVVATLPQAQAARIPSPPTHATTPPSLDDQIKAAEQSGDWQTAMSLKNRKLVAATLTLNR